MSSKAIRMTRDYSLFALGMNRDIDPARVKAKKATLAEHGWLWTQPMTVRRVGAKLQIVDGQHRFAAAQQLGISVCFAVVEEAEAIDLPNLNTSVAKWTAANYGQFFAKKGDTEYSEVLAFAEDNKLPVSDAIAFLAGNQFSNVRKSWTQGEFRITDREHAQRIAFMWRGITSLPGVKGTRSLRAALAALSRVDGFDAARLITKAARIPDLLRVNYATREGALEMLEQIYNYGVRERYPLKVNAENAMRARNPATGGAK